MKIFVDLALTLHSSHDQVKDRRRRRGRQGRAGKAEQARQEVQQDLDNFRSVCSVAQVEYLRRGGLWRHKHDRPPSEGART